MTTTPTTAIKFLSTPIEIDPWYRFIEVTEIDGRKEMTSIATYAADAFSGDTARKQLEEDCPEMVGASWCVKSSLELNKWWNDFLDGLVNLNEHSAVNGCA